MATIHVGTAGFAKPPVRYGKTLKFVEIELRSPLPSIKTVQRWRQELPEGFAFSAVAHAALWGERDWPLRDANAVQTELDRLANLCHALSPAALVLRTPAAVRPGTVAFKRFHELLKRVRKLAAVIVWEPQGVWEREDAQEAVKGTGTLVVADPLRDDVSGEPKVYARMRGLGGDRRYHAGRLEDLAEALAHTQESFVVFDTQAGFLEAGRLAKVIAGGLLEDDDEDEEGEAGEGSEKGDEDFEDRGEFEEGDEDFEDDESGEGDEDFEGGDEDFEDDESGEGDEDDDGEGDEDEEDEEAP